MFTTSHLRSIAHHHHELGITFLDLAKRFERRGAADDAAEAHASADYHWRIYEAAVARIDQLASRGAAA